MKKVFVLFTVILLLLVFSGCSFMDSLFYKTDSVESKDLTEYTGTTPADKSSAMDVIDGAAGDALASGFQGILSNDQWNNFSKTISSGYPALKIIARSILSKTEAAAKTITYSGDRDGSDGNVDFKVSITDESVKGNQTGTLTVDNFDLAVKAETDDPDTPTKGSWDFNTNGKIKIDNFSNSSAYTINDGLINFKAKGNGNLSFTVADSVSTLDKLKYYLAIDLKAGFSVSGGDGKSGKFIIEFSYVNSNSLTKDELKDPAKLMENMTLSVVIKVYNNDNTLVHTYKYDENDLKNRIQNS
ncbi:MAG: hypothetical protein GXP33_06465 [Spirochaetes bacterium]|nr:hypothetical protein [Spirochaetota bacterium]